MADAGAAAASVGVFRCCSHEADAPREAALLEALAQHDVAAATTDLDAIRLDFADGAAPAGQAFYALYSAASARSIATYARGRRPPHRCPDPRPPPELNGACCWRSATAVVEWLLSRPGDPQAGGAERALVIPSIRALQLGRSKLGCHAALSKAGLPAARTVAVLSPAGAASAAVSLCAASGGCFHAREDCGGRWLVGGGGELTVPARWHADACVALQAGQTARWSWSVVKYDVGFHTDVLSDNAAAGWQAVPIGVSESGEAVAAGQLTGEGVRVSGSHAATEAAVLRLRWDNAHAWTTSKTIKYSLAMDGIAGEGREDTTVDGTAEPEPEPAA